MAQKWPKLAQNGQKSCFWPHHLKSSNGFCWPKSKMSHVTVKEMNIMSFVFDAFSPFWPLFGPFFTYAPSRGPNFYQKSVIFTIFTQKSSFFWWFFINCCKIGNIHKNNIEKTPKKIIDFTVFQPIFYCVSTHFWGRFFSIFTYAPGRGPNFYHENTKNRRFLVFCRFGTFCEKTRMPYPYSRIVFFGHFWPFSIKS